MTKEVTVGRQVAKAGGPLALQHPDVLKIGRHAFVTSEAYWNRINQALPDIGFAMDPSDTPRGAEALFVHPDSDKMRRAKCEPCGHLNSTNGCQFEGGFWCSGCGTLLHLGCSAEPGRESVFELSLTGERENGWTPSYEVRLRLIDYDPVERTILVSREPLGSRYARSEEDGPDPEVARQQGYLERFADRLRPEMATHRLTIDDDIGHSRLDTPVPAFKFAWPLHNRPDGSEKPNGPGVHIHCQGGVGVHRQTEVLVAGPTKEVVAVAGAFGLAPDATLTIIPAFRVYPLKQGPNLLNQVFDNIGRSEFTLLPDYVSRTGGWDPTRLSKQVLEGARRFAEAFTAIDLEGWDRVVAEHGHRHHAHLFIELARHCDPDHSIRTGWWSSRYSEISIKEAEDYLERNLPPEHIEFDPDMDAYEFFARRRPGRW